MIAQIINIEQQAKATPVEEKRYARLVDLQLKRKTDVRPMDDFCVANIAFERVRQKVETFWLKRHPYWEWRYHWYYTQSWQYQPKEGAPIISSMVISKYAARRKAAKKVGLTVWDYNNLERIGNVTKVEEVKKYFNELGFETPVTDRILEQQAEVLKGIESRRKIKRNKK
jgi:hypothetical protein